MKEQDTSIYNANGTLANDRQVALNGKKLSFTGNGNMVIGTAPDNNAKLHVEGPLRVGYTNLYAGGFQVTNFDASKSVMSAYSAANAELFRLTNAGNLGLGTTTPTQKLHINNGKIRIVDGTQGNGKVLTSDGSGVGTWQESNSANIGDIKYSVLKADHKGWYILNGRAVSSLPTVARNNASSLSSKQTRKVN